MHLTFLRRGCRSALALTAFIGLFGSVYASPLWALWYLSASLWMIGSLTITATLLIEIMGPQRRPIRLAGLALGKVGMLGLLAAALLLFRIPPSAAFAGLAGLNTIFLVLLLKTLGGLMIQRQRAAMATQTSLDSRN